MADAPLPPPPWRTPRREPPARKPLSQDAIVDAAMDVLAAEGFDAVSMRRVAQALGTGPASLYQHVSGREELLELMLDRVAADTPLPEPDPERWQEQLKQLARDVHARFVAHNGIARAAIARIPTSPNALAVSDAMLGVLRAGDLSAQVCSYAADLLFQYVTADAFEQGAYSELDPPEIAAQRRDQIGAYFAALPPERFPNIVALAGPLMEGGGDERFEFGLDVIVRGIAAHAPGATPSA